MKQLLFKLLSTLFCELGLLQRRIRWDLNFLIIKTLFLRFSLRWFILESFIRYFWNWFHVSLWGNISIRKHSAFILRYINSQISSSWRSSSPITFFHFLMWLSKSQQSGARWLIIIFYWTLLGYYWWILRLRIGLLLLSFFVLVCIILKICWSFDFFLKFIHIY